MGYAYYELDWMAMTPQERADRRMLSHVWAKENVKPGDKAYVTRCGGRSVVTIVGWDGMWLASKTLSDISPLHILRLNGKPANNPGHYRSL